jgi:hypothetical protein
VFSVYSKREPQKNLTAAEKGKIIVYQIKKTIEKRFPELLESFNSFDDSRKRFEYSMAEILTGALFLFLFKQTSRNAYNNDRRDACFTKNYYLLF